MSETRRRTLYSRGQEDAKQGQVGQRHDSEWSDHVILDVCLCKSDVLAAVRPDYDLDEYGRGTRRVRRAHARDLIDDSTRDDGPAQKSQPISRSSTMTTSSPAS